MGLYRAHQADSLLEFPCSAPCPSLLLRAMKRSLDAMRMTDDEQWDWLEELTGFKCAARPPQSTAPSGAVGAEPKRTTVRSRTIREEPTQGTDSPQESQKRPEPSAKVQEERTSAEAQGRSDPAPEKRTPFRLCRWMLNLRQEFQNEPAWEEIQETFRALEANPAMEVSLGPRRAGAALRHCLNVISSRLDRGPTVFKLGITSDPVRRFEYYREDVDRFTKMLILSVSLDSGYACMLEASLIQHFQESHRNNGLRNVATGGENCPPNVSVVYNYVVYKRLL